MKTQKTILNATVMIGCLTLGFSEIAFSAPGKAGASNPDFTKGGKKDENHDWNLGPTGARGWIFSSVGQTHESRQILITQVAKGSPADGVLQVGDVILGVGEKPFENDARILFAKAIGAAEVADSDGKMKLIRWRDGKTENVSLKLETIGTYRSTVPYDCPKSDRIFEKGCKAIASRGLEKISMPNSLNALALLASGKKEYQPMLAEYAKKVSEYRVDGFASWFYGYAMLYLAEYVAETGDQSVMPGLVRISKEIANGASGVGTWGHKFARPDGNCNGYGAMNSPGIVLATALVIAREAGVKDPDVDKAIEKSSGFLRWYVNKGAIPYGDHKPWPGHEDNGKCSGAAILFDLLGDAEATEFFGRMSTAAYDERERGHTGNFFNMTWALPGVARSGPLATGAYMKEHAWYYDLAREWDGSFGYQGSPQGEEEHKKYTRWDCTGAYMLSYALGKKSLYLTGKKPLSCKPLDSKQVAEVIAAGRDYFSPTGKMGAGYTRRSTEQLLAGLSSWSPAVRKRSANELSNREGDFIPQLMKLLSSSDRYSRYGACEALAMQGPKADKAGPQLRALLNDPDPWLQSLACYALPALGEKERQASIPAILEVAGRVNPKDPRGMINRAASAALFTSVPGRRNVRGILSGSLEGVDRDLLYPAIKAVLENEDGHARGSISRVLGKLSDRDLVTLLPAIVKAVEKLAPSNEMFADGIRLAGLDLLSRLHIREGMPLCISVIEMDRWGGGRRMPKCLHYLSRYGVHAKEVMPQLKEMREQLVKRSRGGAKNKTVVELDKAIAKVESSKASPRLLNLKDFKRTPRSSR